MDREHRIILAAAARLLNYPEDDFPEELDCIRECVQEEIGPGPLQQALERVMEPLAAVSLWELREIYVATFDLKEKAGLYLTAHEIGDSRERGVALIELQTMIRGSGYIPRADELPDFLPMLCEWLAFAEDSDYPQQLAKRMALAFERIRVTLPEEHVYRPLCNLLMDAVFEEPTAEELEQAEQARAKPDLDPMPYPLMYK